jgi:hypothetical protein
MTDRMSATGAAAGAAPNTDPSAPHIPTSAPAPGHTLTLSAFWQEYAFSVGGIDFLQFDVALAAMVFGDWAPFEKRLAEGLACAARATAENLPAPTSLVEEAAVAFRYERDLISGADITAWLERAGFSADVWMAYITRDVLRQLWSDDLEDILDRYGPSPRQLETAAIPEGISSRVFSEFERIFEGRAAIAFDADAALFESRAHLSKSRAEAAARLARQHAHWLDGRSDTVARLRVIFEIRERYAAAAEALVTERALNEIIEAYRLDWAVIDTDTLSFADESAAREALLCVTEDRLSLADIGGLSRQPLVRRHGFLDDVAPEHRHRLLAAEPGRVIGPLLVDGRYHVTTVTNRAVPTLEDAHVARRAREMFLDQIAHRAAREHVRRRRVSS